MIGEVGANERARPRGHATTIPRDPLVVFDKVRSFGVERPSKFVIHRDGKRVKWVVARYEERRLLNDTL